MTHHPHPGARGQGLTGFDGREDRTRDAPEPGSIPGRSTSPSKQPPHPVKGASTMISPAAARTEVNPATVWGVRYETTGNVE